MAFNTRMANGNANPYASSGVIVDTTAPVQYYLQQQAHKAAKEEATDKYLQGMLEVDDKGMRNQERPDLIGMRTKLQDQYIKNRDAILHPEKDNGKALLEYRGAIQGMKSFVNKSAAEREEDKRIATLSDWAKKEGLKMPDDVMNVIQKRNYSINDPRFHKDPQAMTGGYTSSDIEPFYKPFGTAEQNKWIDAAMQGIKPDEVEHPNKKPIVKDGLLYTYKINQFGKDKLAQIGNSANTLYDNVPAAKRYFESEFKDPNELIKYNQIFKNQYGTDIQSPRDVAVAWTLSKVPQAVESFSTQNDPSAWRDKMREQEAKEKRMFGFKHKGQEKIANTQLIELTNNSVPLGERHLFSTATESEGGHWSTPNMRVTTIPPDLAEGLSIRDKVGDKDVTTKPYELVISEDGQRYAPLFTTTKYLDEKGKITEDDKKAAKDDLGKPKTVEVAAKPKYWLTKKQLAATILKRLPKGEEGVALGDEAIIDEPIVTNPSTSTLNAANWLKKK